MGKKAAKRTAADIFENRDKRGKRPRPPDAVLNLIRDVALENDGRPKHKRVGAEYLAGVLDKDYDFRVGERGLSAICRDFLGRRSWTEAAASEE